MPKALNQPSELNGISDVNEFKERKPFTNVDPIQGNARNGDPQPPKGPDKATAGATVEINAAPAEHTAKIFLNMAFCALLLPAASSEAAERRGYVRERGK